MKKSAINDIVNSLKDMKRASNGDKSIPVAKTYKEAIKLLTK